MWAARTGEPLPWRNHLFLLRKPPVSAAPRMRLGLRRWPLVHSITAGVFQSSASSDWSSWREMRLKRAPGEGLLFLPSVLFHFLIYFSSFLFLSGELRAHFSPEGLIILSCTPRLRPGWLLIVGHPICLESLSFQEARRLSLLAPLQPRTVICRGRTLAWSRVWSWSLGPTKNSSLLTWLTALVFPLLLQWTHTLVLPSSTDLPAYAEKEGPKANRVLSVDAWTAGPCGRKDSQSKPALRFADHAGEALSGREGCCGLSFGTLKRRHSLWFLLKRGVHCIHITHWDHYKHVLLFLDGRFKDLWVFALEQISDMAWIMWNILKASSFSTQALQFSYYILKALFFF